MKYVLRISNGERGEKQIYENSSVEERHREKSVERASFMLESTNGKLFRFSSRMENLQHLDPQPKKKKRRIASTKRSSFLFVYSPMGIPPN